MVWPLRGRQPEADTVLGQRSVGEGTLSKHKEGQGRGRADPVRLVSGGTSERQLPPDAQTEGDSRLAQPTTRFAPLLEVLICRKAGPLPSRFRVGRLLLRLHRDPTNSKREHPRERLPYVRIPIQSLQRSEPRRVDIDRGDTASRSAACAREQKKTPVSPHGPSSLLARQRLKEDFSRLDLFAERVHGGPPSGPTSFLGLQLDFDQLRETNLAHAEISVIHTDYGHREIGPHHTSIRMGGMGRLCHP